MSDQLQAMLQQAGAVAPAFPATSRYNKIAVTSLTTPDGTQIAYLKRRFVPPPENFATLLQITVTQGQRLDQIAAKYLGDPEQFWKICDANGAVQPNELLDQVGRTIRITLPENIPGPQNG